jgi:hypothetical protein
VVAEPSPLSGGRHELDLFLERQARRDYVRQPRIDDVDDASLLVAAYLEHEAPIEASVERRANAPGFARVAQMKICTRPVVASRTERDVVSTHVYSGSAPGCVGPWRRPRHSVVIVPASRSPRA